MKLISNPRAVWLHYSSIALLTASSIQGLWASIPDFVKVSLPDFFEKGVSWVTFVITVLGLIGKFIDQTPKKDI